MVTDAGAARVTAMSAPAGALVVVDGDARGGRSDTCGRGDDARGRARDAGRRAGRAGRRGCARARRRCRRRRDTAGAGSARGRGRRRGRSRCRRRDGRSRRGGQRWNRRRRLRRDCGRRHGGRIVVAAAGNHDAAGNPSAYDGDNRRRSNSAGPGADDARRKEARWKSARPRPRHTHDDLRDIALKESRERISSAAFVALRNLGCPLLRARALERLTQGLDVVNDAPGLGCREGKDGLDLAHRIDDGVHEVEVGVVLRAEVNPDAAHVVPGRDRSGENGEEIGRPTLEVVMRNRERLGDTRDRRKKENGVEESFDPSPQCRTQRDPPGARMGLSAPARRTMKLLG